MLGVGGRRGLLIVGGSFQAVGVIGGSETGLLEKFGKIVT